MGKADIITKQYLTDNSVFADAFNFFLYNGKQVLQPDQLRPLDSVAAETIFADTGTTIPIQKIRDNLKYLTMMTDDSVAYAILGIENQTDVHYAMPVRNMLYDAMEYSRQVQHISAKHRKEQHCDISSGEYLSGFYQSDRLFPVITLVIYFGASEWDAPTCLHDMIQVPDHSLLQQIENYRIRLIAPQQLTETDFRKFSTSLGLVLHFIKYSKEKEKLQLLMQDWQAFQALDCTAAMVINTCTRAGLQFDSDEGAINMCKALDDMREESRQEGRQEATRNLACSLLRDGTLPLEKIAQLTEISLTELHAMKQTYSA